MTDGREARRERFRAELVARLLRVRGDLTDAQFDELVERVERTAARFGEIDRGRGRGLPYFGSKRRPWSVGRIWPVKQAACVQKVCACEGTRRDS